MSDSEYLSSLKSPELGLRSPLPLEITGSRGNFVATWLEGSIEGEGATREAAVEDCRLAVIDRFKELRSKFSL